MAWIQNVSKENVVKGIHKPPGDKSLLIQIVDPATEFPTPKFKFKEVHQFEFLDAEEHEWTDAEDFKISQKQADELVAILQHALDSGMNVIVHCVAGLCRSGAVTEIGVIMGFEDTNSVRLPNLLVKWKMLKSLDLLYE